MSVPKSRKTSSAVGRRRSHHSLKQTNVSECEKCQAPVVSHRACAQCGNYNGRQATEVASPAAPVAVKATTSKAKPSEAGSSSATEAVPAEKTSKKEAAFKKPARKAPQA